MAARHPPCRALNPKEKDYKASRRTRALSAALSFAAIWAGGGQTRTFDMPDCLPACSHSIKYIEAALATIPFHDLKKAGNRESHTVTRGVNVEWGHSLSPLVIWLRR